jgi:hypothetical protein
MKTKVKKYAKGMLTDSSGNPVRSSSGEPVRTRSDDEIAEDSKFGGYGRYMPKGGSLTRGIKETSRPSEDLAPYEAPSTMAGDQLPKSTTSKNMMEEPATGPASTFDADKYLEGISPKSGGSGRKTKPKKNAIVSKKQLEESGFQSLRDYLNDQQGKSRKMASGGKVSSASSRGDGIAQRGKTKGRMC